MSSREKPKVVCVRSLVPKLKNSASCGNLLGHQSGTRQLDHGSHQVIDRRALLLEDLLGDAADDVALVLHLLDAAGQRNHDLRIHVDALLLDIDGGLQNGARLHLGDLRIGDSQAAAAMAEHGVDFVQLFHACSSVRSSFSFGDLGLGDLELGDFDHQVFALGQELVQRRIERADGNREARPSP